MNALTFESTTYLTQAQFAEWVAHRDRRRDLNHYELLNGRVVMNPPAGWPHGATGSRVAARVGAFALSRGLGQTFDSSQGFELPSGDTVEPDYAWVSDERWNALSEREAGEFLRVVPDLVVEILSTRTATYDRGEKKAVYERNGVREYWLVDPRARTVTMFLLEEGRFGAPQTFGEDDRFRSQVLTGLELEVRSLFP